MANDLYYKKDIYNAVKKELDDYAYYSNIPNGLYSKILTAIENAKSSYWHPCTDEKNIPPKGQEVLVTLKYPNRKTEIAFGENYGHDRNGDIAYWGGQNELVVAWGEVPSAYEGDI